MSGSFEFTEEHRRVLDKMQATGIPSLTDAECVLLKQMMGHVFEHGNPAGRDRVEMHLADLLGEDIAAAAMGRHDAKLKND